MESLHPGICHFYHLLKPKEFWPLDQSSAYLVWLRKPILCHCSWAFWACAQLIKFCEFTGHIQVPKACFILLELKLDKSLKCQYTDQTVVSKDNY